MSVHARRIAARFAVVALASATLVGLGASGASGGLPPSGVFDMPAGTTLAFVAPSLSACNNIEWGYEIDGESPVVVNEKDYGCTSVDFPDTRIGPFTTDVSLRVFLTDNYCSGATYYSDGTPVDHAAVTGSGPWNVQIADAGGDCEDVEDPRGGGNLEVDLQINPVLTVQKVVAGDDPGVAFPIDVSCTAAGEIPTSVETAAASEIVLDGPDATDSTQVSLAGGESADIPIALESVYIDSVACTVSESLAGTTLPAGYTCADPVVDHPEVVWENGEWSAAPVTVTNTCTRAVEVAPTFTG